MGDAVAFPRPRQAATSTLQSSDAESEKAPIERPAVFVKSDPPDPSDPLGNPDPRFETGLVEPSDPSVPHSFRASLSARESEYPKETERFLLAPSFAGSLAAEAIDSAATREVVERSDAFEIRGGLSISADPSSLDSARNILPLPQPPPFPQFPLSSSTTLSLESSFTMGSPEISASSSSSPKLYAQSLLNSLIYSQEESGVGYA